MRQFSGLGHSRKNKFDSWTCLVFFTKDSLQGSLQEDLVATNVKVIVVTQAEDLFKVFLLLSKLQFLSALVEADYAQTIFRLTFYSTAGISKTCMSSVVEEGGQYEALGCFSKIGIIFNILKQVIGLFSNQNSVEDVVVGDHLVKID